MSDKENEENTSLQAHVSLFPERTSMKHGEFSSLAYSGAEVLKVNSGDKSFAAPVPAPRRAQTNPNMLLQPSDKWFRSLLKSLTPPQTYEETSENYNGDLIHGNNNNNNNNNYKNHNNNHYYAKSKVKENSAYLSSPYRKEDHDRYKSYDYSVAKSVQIGKPLMETQPVLPIEHTASSLTGHHRSRSAVTHSFFSSQVVYDPSVFLTPTKVPKKFRSQQQQQQQQQERQQQMLKKQLRQQQLQQKRIHGTPNKSITISSSHTISSSPRIALFQDHHESDVDDECIDEDEGDDNNNNTKNDDDVDDQGKQVKYQHNHNNADTNDKIRVEQNNLQDSPVTDKLASSRLLDRPRSIINIRTENSSFVTLTSNSEKSSPTGSSSSIDPLYYLEKNMPISSYLGSTKEFTRIPLFFDDDVNDVEDIYGSFRLNKSQADSSERTGIDDVPTMCDIILNVYDLKSEDNPALITRINNVAYFIGLGLFHTGVEIGGREFGYAGHFEEVTGVFEVRPKCTYDAVFRKSIIIDTIEISPQGIQSMVESIQSEYPGNKYNLLSNNCNHFSEDLVYRLCQKKIPRWINRLAWIGNNVKCLVPPELESPATAPVTAPKSPEPGPRSPSGMRAGSKNSRFSSRRTSID